MLPGTGNHSESEVEMLNERYVRREGRRLVLSALLMAASGSLSACDGLLDVEVPGDMTEAELFNPEMAETMVVSAIADFECGFSNYTVAAFGFEDGGLSVGGLWREPTWYTDNRPPTGACGGTDSNRAWYRELQKSRHMSETAYDLLSGWGADEVSDRERLMATAATYAGLFYQYTGETFCEFAPAAGPLLSPEEMLQQGERWFDRAIAHLDSSGDFAFVGTESMRQLAHLGRARVRFALGDDAGAAVDAAEVQPGFVAWATRDGSVSSRWNGPHWHLTVNSWWSIAGPTRYPDVNGEIVTPGWRDLTISADGRPTVDDGTPDPRVPVFLIDGIGAGAGPQYNQSKYSSFGDDHHLAKYAEAQFILAEIEGGQAAVDRINALRDEHGIAPYQAGTSFEEIRALIIEERRREFFLEGRHFPDKLRYDLWFPRGTGRNQFGFAFGISTCLLMSQGDYENNPNIPQGYLGPNQATFVWPVQR